MLHAASHRYTSAITTQVKTKALKLAALIRKEKGVEAGVESFHRHAAHSSQFLYTLLSCKDLWFATATHMLHVDVLVQCHARS